MSEEEISKIELAATQINTQRRPLKVTWSTDTLGETDEEFNQRVIDHKLKVITGENPEPLKPRKISIISTEMVNKAILEELEKESK
jgi:hypothetical protein